MYIIYNSEKVFMKKPKDVRAAVNVNDAGRPRKKIAGKNGGQDGVPPIGALDLALSEDPKRRMKGLKAMRGDEDALVFVAHNSQHWKGRKDAVFFLTQMSGKLSLKGLKAIALYGGRNSTNAISRLGTRCEVEALFEVYHKSAYGGISAEDADSVQKAIIEELEGIIEDVDDPDTLLKIVRSNDISLSRKASFKLTSLIQGMDEPKALTELADSGDRRVKKAAIARLAELVDDMDDRDALLAVAYHSNKLQAVQTAIDKLDEDVDTLKRHFKHALANDKKELKLAVAGKLSSMPEDLDLTALCYVVQAGMCHDGIIAGLRGHEGEPTYAEMNELERTAIALDVDDSSPPISEKALDCIVDILPDDAERFGRIAARTKHVGIRAKVLERIDDVVTLLHLSRHSSKDLGNAVAKRLEAVSADIDDEQRILECIRFAGAHENPLLQKLASMIDTLTDKRSFKLLACYADDKDVRAIALEKIGDDEEALRSVAVSSRYLDTKSGAIDRLGDNAHALWIVASASTLPGVQQDETALKLVAEKFAAMVNQLSGEEPLLLVAMHSEDRDARKKAVEKLTDQKNMVLVAKEADVSDARKAALERIEDDNDLKAVALEGRYKDTREEAVESIENTRILRDIIFYADDADIAIAAVEMLSDENEILINIACHSEHEFKHLSPEAAVAAVGLLSDSVAAMEIIAIESRNKAAKMAALGYVTDVEVLTEIAVALERRTFYNEALVEVVRKLADSLDGFDSKGHASALKAIAMNAESLDTCFAAIRKLDEPGILANIALESKRKAVWKAALDKIKFDYATVKSVADTDRLLYMSDREALEYAQEILKKEHTFLKRVWRRVSSWWRRIFRTR